MDNLELFVYVTNTECIANASVVLAPAGGQAPYVLTGSPTTGLTAGNYTYTVKDALNNMVSTSVTIVDHVMCDCCLNFIVKSVNLAGGFAQVHGTQSYNNNSIYPSYSFSLTTIASITIGFIITYNPATSSWTLRTTTLGPTNDIALSTFVFAAGQCPFSDIVANITVPGFMAITEWIVFPVECNVEDNDLPIDEEEDVVNCAELFSCKFVNLIKKEKANLSNDIASMRNKELFGIGACKTSWNDIFRNYLIMDALQCAPYGTYSKEDENCLISKLSENCNC